jgi:hypothetical protein
MEKDNSTARNPPFTLTVLSLLNIELTCT